MNTQHTLLKKILLVAVVLVAIICLIIVWLSITFRIVSTDPALDKVSTISAYFKVTFNKKLSNNNLHVTSTPSGFVGTAYITNQSIIIPFKTILQSGKHYSITIISVESTSGKQLTNKVFNFTPTYIPSSQLSKEQQQAILKNELGGGYNSSDPILSHLPYNTTSFNLTQDTTKPQGSSTGVPLFAVIKLAGADMGNPDAAIAQYKQQIADYISSLGLNPANYPITYTIQQP